MFRRELPSKTSPPDYKNFIDLNTLTWNEKIKVTDKKDPNSPVIGPGPTHDINCSVINWESAVLEERAAIGIKQVIEIKIILNHVGRFCSMQVIIFYKFRLTYYLFRFFSRK